VPIVTVIIPTYNRRQYLSRAIESVLEQTFRDYELLIIDDASKDDTRALVSEYTDSRIQYFRHETNRGAPAARNTGLRHAKGEFIAFLDSDNEWLPQRLEKQIALFSAVNASVGVVYANNLVVDEVNNSTTEWAFGLRGNLYGEFLQRPFMDFITPLIRRECFDKIGFMDEKVPSYQEWDTFLRISRYYEFDYVPEILAHYYIHKENRISKGPLSEARGYEYILDKHREEMLSVFSPRVMIEHHRNLARFYKAAGAYLKMFENLLFYVYYKSFFRPQ